MALSPAQMLYVRSEIGEADPPSEADINEVFALTTRVSETVLVYLRRLRAAFITGGAISYAIAGFVSEDGAANLRALDEAIARVGANAAAIDAGEYGEGLMGRGVRVRAGWSRTSGRDRSDLLLP